MNKDKILGFDGYVTAETCLKILFPDQGLCLRTFRSLQAMGRIPFLKIGRRTLFNPVEVRAALERTCKRGCSMTAAFSFGRLFLNPLDSSCICSRHYCSSEQCSLNLNVVFAFYGVVLSMYIEFQLLDVRAVARLTGLTVDAVRWHIRKKHLPANRLAGHFVFSQAAVDAFIEQRKQGFAPIGSQGSKPIKNRKAPHRQK